VDIVFNASAGSSLGVEVELGIVDRGSRELRSGASEILRRLEKERGEPHPKAKNELIESNIEIITGICSTVAEARVDLEETSQVDQDGIKHKKFLISGQIDYAGGVRGATEASAARPGKAPGVGR